MIRFSEGRDLEALKGLFIGGCSFLLSYPSCLGEVYLQSISSAGPKKILGAPLPHVAFALYSVDHPLALRSRYVQRSVIRLSLGKLLVNLSQVVKRTNTPLIP